MVSDHILLTTLNNVLLDVSFKGGVQSEFYCCKIYHCSITSTILRCTAPANRLDNPPDDICVTPRWLAHTTLILEIMELDQLWDEYGLVGKVVVHFSQSSSPSAFDWVAQSLEAFTKDIPRADIHELISPDILHQVVKGAFKDHIVDWIQAYIGTVNPENHAREVLDDIDKRWGKHLWGSCYLSWWGFHQHCNCPPIHRHPSFLRRTELSTMDQRQLKGTDEGYTTPSFS